MEKFLFFELLVLVFDSLCTSFLGQKDTVSDKDVVQFNAFRRKVGLGVVWFPGKGLAQYPLTPFGYAYG